MRNIDIVDVKACIRSGRFQLLKKDNWILLEDCETGERVCIGEDVPVKVKRAHWKHSQRYQCMNKQNELLECSRCGHLFAREPGMLKPMKCEKCDSVMENGEGEKNGEYICMATLRTCSECTPGPCSRRREAKSAEETDRS